MSCDLARTLLDGYLDGELDAARAAEFERHLETCADCIAALETEESLRTALRRGQLYEKAPAQMRERILLATRPAAKPAAVPRSNPWQWLAVAASLLLVLFAGWRWIPGIHGADDPAALSAQVVDAHLRSLQPGHLTDVVSTDQHTVKPWFTGKLDFSPPVGDFASEGFPLQGGRLDVVNGRTVAALVYARRKHLISVFIWPTPANDATPTTGSRQGYHWIRWQQGNMQFAAVSDVSATDLNELQRLLAR